ncbi:MAG: DUF4199 domain-containing protein [Bacteroidota bacterium]
MKNIKIEIKWAIAFAVMTLVWMLLEKLCGLHSTYIDKHATYTNFIAIPAITIYVLALLDKRKNFYNGKMTYQQGLKSGIIITLLYTPLSPVTQAITSLVITPEYFPNATNYAINLGMMSETEAKEYFTLKNYIIQGLIGAPIMGIITTLIVALFTRKN